MNHVHALYAIVLTLLFAVAAGLVGSIALMKRMLLAGDVVSHLALPGLGLALMLHFNPLLGAGVTLFLGTFLVARLENRTGLAADAAIAVVFAACVALAAALTPAEDLEEALFGKFQELSFLAFLGGVLAAAIVILFILRFRDQLVLSLFSPELAAADGIRLNALNLRFLMIFSLTVLIGLRFMGALLAGALIMLPAAIGRVLSNDLYAFLWVSSLSSLAAVCLGYLITYIFPRVSIGPATTIVAAILFGLILICERNGILKRAIHP